MDQGDNATSAGDRGWWIAAIFVGGVLVLAILFAVYVLLWDGGAHT
jgi:hypothetical protein